MFRPEASVKRSARLSGDVLVAVPPSWQVIGYFLFGSVAAASLFLVSMDYARTVTASGVIIHTPAGMSVASSRDSAPLRAELAVPSSSIGFVERGQEVELAVDAFPYQQFGTVRGQVLEIGQASTSRRTSSGNMVTSDFPVTVEIGRNEIMALGRARALRPGMGLTAHIVTAKQTLWQWLFEPLLAAAGRKPKDA